ncbi:MAG: hypothetical protein MRZ79_04445 [Bacteroidia bacterium]|nr:hypothetical protein [Bacteroidia bacterium]
MRNKQSLLKKGLLDFLALRELEERQHEKEAFILSQLRKRGLKDVFEIEAKRMRKKKMQKSIQTEAALFGLYRMADEANIFFGQSQVRKEDDSLQEKLDYLEQYFLRVRLREACEMLNRKQLLNTDLKNDFFEEWLKVKENELNNFKDPGLEVYLQIYRCYKFRDDPEEYLKMIELIRNSHSFFPASEAKAIFRHAQNHCIRHINQGSRFFLEELFRLYQFQLSQEIIFQEGLLDHSDYKNIVTVAIRLEEFEWAEDFIQHFRERVEPAYRDNVYQFCQANIFEAKGAYTAAIGFLSKVTFSDVFYEISSRLLLLRMYYKLRDWEGLFYSTGALERFLKRSQSISRDRKSAHLAFVWAIRALGKLMEKRESLVPKEFERKRSLLQEKILAKGNMTQLKWVVDELNA